MGNKNEKKLRLELGGKLITPVLQPMGIKNDNWPASVALISWAFLPKRQLWEPYKVSTKIRKTKEQSIT